MEEKIDIRKTKLEQLNLRLADIEAERNCIEKELQALGASLTKGASTGLCSRATLAVVTVLAVVSLLATGLFHDARSSVKPENDGVAAVSTTGTEEIVRAERRSASGKIKAPASGKAKARSYRKKATQRQWGPLLVMSEPQTAKRYYGYDPVVKAQQKNLLTLGFDVGEADGFKGPNTRRAIAEFRALYLPDSGARLKDGDLAVTIEAYANLARSDAARFGIDHGVIAAIRLSSVRTGVDFSYLMKLAATESNFEPESKAATSSATGLYQFTHDTWLNALKTHGEKYGIVADYAAKIDYYTTWSGYKRPVLREKAMYEHLLELRKNPRVSAILAAETVRENQQKLVHTLGREPTETDLYLTHFLGADDAITFLQSLEQSPDKHAVELFPEAARSNHAIFHPSSCDPHTVDDVYALFEEKLSRRRFEQPDAPEPGDQNESLKEAQSPGTAYNKSVKPDQWDLGRAL
jgi:hypothetical protein